MIMKFFLVFFSVLFSVQPVYAFKCPDKSSKEYYDEAERVFLIYVTETMLDDALWKEMNKGYPAGDDESESVKAIFAKYRVIEEFKGDPAYQPRLVDVLGIGTGYVGLAPGKYYFLMLNKNDDAPKDVRGVSFCNAPLEHYRLHVKQFQEELEPFRIYRDTSKWPKK